MRRLRARKVPPAGSTRRRGDDDGAAAVEAAIIIPVLAMIIFGIIEFGMLFRASLSFSNAARAGARTAVALPRVPSYASAAQQAVSGALRNTVNPSEINYLTIFRADPVTGQPISGGTVKTCTSQCYRYTWNSATSQWTPVNGPSWSANTQRACGQEASTDYLGIYVEGQYQWKTGIFRPFFGDSTTIGERTIMRLEPIGGSTQCQ